MRTKLRRRTIQVAALAVALVVVLSGCISSGQTAVQNELNADRSAYALRRLPTHGQLNTKAQAWAEKLARDGVLSHSNLTSGVPGCWRALGENVGYGSSAAGVQDAYMRSTKHRDNVLDRRWSYVGVGYAKAGSRVYTVQVFMQGC
ncbi:CAP domain-containing protein [Iamia sp. SCSIO 61187]|uniref:CAP domain-containing protein n=1 Tax=Iamia sp. SCSIO 61187 TaxID=2722752 RepID=UPI001C636FB5|nr:CAP domain-containing protein [Iamia sp. SCSIO 61187]QYG93884.1 CAP domain-containing protein [Iamia sp. SCSIO 61187]